MKTRYKKTFLGSMLAFIVGTSCCWLSSLAVCLGGATFFSILSRFVETYNSIIMGIAGLFFIVAIFQLWKHKRSA